MSLNSFARVSQSNTELNSMYGPLADLIGIWSGNKGVNLVAVPDQKGGFTLLVAPYSETLTVTALSSPTPNRGLETIENIPTLMYNLSIYNSIDNSLMHAENGIWELVDPNANNGFDSVRMLSVPHGDSIISLGTSSIISTRPPIDPSLSSLPTGGLPPRFGYKDVYDPEYVPGFVTHSPNQYLIDYLNEQEKNGLTVIQSVNLPISTANSGNISNIPSIDKNTATTRFDSIFWIETVQDSATGKTFQQLQYSQNSTIDFPVIGTPKGETIHWPHINVNTLVKQ